MKVVGSGDQWLTLDEAARYCGVKVRTLYNWREAGLLVSKPNNGTVRIRRRDLDAFLDSKKMNGGQSWPASAQTATAAVESCS
jgi:excisionase family DNA binding protein